MNEFKIKNGLVSDGNIVVTGSITATGGINISGSIASAETASFAPSYTLSSSFNSYTSSASSSVGSLSSSVATTTSELSSSIGSLSGSIATTTSGLASRIGSVETKTGSYATTGSNIFVGSQVITGSLYITNDMVVQGCSCLQNITASAVSIGTNVVMLNTATPAVRFAGISVQDSGSNAGVTGSIFWDGLCNKWIYSNPSTVGYSGGMLISGPRNTGTIGNESPLTCNYIAKSGGGDHIYDSCIIDDGTTVCVIGNFVGTGTATFNNDVSIVESGNALLRVHASTNTSPMADIELMRGTNTTWGTDGYGDYRFRNCAGDLTIQYGDTGAVCTRLTIASTGTATFSGNVTAPNYFSTSATTGYAYSYYTNTCAAMYMGIERSTGGGLFTGSSAYATVFGSANATNLQFGTNGIIRLTLDTTGNFGIGTTSPRAVLTSANTCALTLDSNDENHTGFGLYVQAPSTTNTISSAIGFGVTARKLAAIAMQTYADADQAGLNFYVQPTASGSSAVLTEAMRITNCGNVGIGTCTPFSKLSLPSGTGWNGGLAWNYTSANGASKRWWINTDQIVYGDFRIATEITQGCGIISSAPTLCERFYINNSGSVGIGTTNPSAYGFFGVVGTNTVNTLTGVAAGFSDNVLGTTRLYIQSGVNGINVDQAFAVSTGGGVPVERMRISTTGVATFTSSTTGLDNITIKNASGKTNVIIGSAGGTALFGGMQMFDNTSTAAVYLITDTSANSYLFSGLSLGANLASYKLQISTDSAGKPNGGSWANSSDIRLKENIHTIDNALHKITQLRGVTFDWKDETEQDNIKSSAGFIADEVMLTFPNWVKEVNSSDKQKEIVNDDKIKSLSLPFEFDALLVEAIKELKAEIDELKNK